MKVVNVEAKQGCNRNKHHRNQKCWQAYFLLLCIFSLSLLGSTEGYSRISRFHSQSLRQDAVSLFAMELRSLHVPLQRDTSNYEEVVSSYSGIPRDRILRWYISRAEMNDQVLVEIVYMADDGSAAPQEMKHHQQIEERRKKISTTSFPNSNYNSVLDIYAEYGRQPKPTKLSVEQITNMDMNANNDTINSLETGQVEPVDIDIDPFAYIL